MTYGSPRDPPLQHRNEKRSKQLDRGPPNNPPQSHSVRQKGATTCTSQSPGQSSRNSSIGWESHSSSWQSSDWSGSSYDPAETGNTGTDRATNGGDMAWSDSVNTIIGSYLRLILRLVLFINLFALAILSAYTVTKTTYFVAQWLDRVVFARPW